MSRVRNKGVSNDRKNLEKSSPDDTNLEKKDIMLETTDIGGFSLMFQDPQKEMKWHMTHRNRHVGITQRYLFACTIFQGLFYWSDVIEHKEEGFYIIGVTRLLLGLFSLVGGILVSTGLIIPHQNTVLIMSIIYGVPSLAIYYLGREQLSHWDSLYLVYGLCFLMLPKISPLNFIWGFSGSALFTSLFIYISAFRLAFQEWLLSSVLLLVIVVMFMYISYSAEKSSRERWLLRERLNREHINLQIVASSIQDDLRKAAIERHHAFSLDVFKQRFDYKSIYPPHFHFLSQSNINIEQLSLALYSNLKYNYYQNIRQFDGNNHTQNINTSSIQDNNNDDSDSNTQKQQRFVNEKKTVLFFKGLVAWAICMAMGYTFDLISLPVTATISEVNSSAAFALMMHLTGFSVFLLYFTGQIRWLALNGFVGISLLWAFNLSGMDNKWIVFSTHSVGYIILATVIVIMILVLGGVVLVWTHLIGFLKHVLTRYPQVKDELAQQKVLEQVLLRCLSDSNILSHRSLLHPHMPHMMLAGEDEESPPNYPSSSTRSLGLSNDDSLLESCQDEISPYNSSISSSSLSLPVSSIIPPVKRPHLAVNNSSQDCLHHHQLPPPQSTQTNMTQVLDSRRSNSCFFCLKKSPTFLLPVCAGWGPPPAVASSDNDSSSTEIRQGIPMCTPYTELAKSRELLSSLVTEERLRAETFCNKWEEATRILSESNAQVMELRNKVNSLAAINTAQKLKYDELLLSEKKRKEEELQQIIRGHNSQLTELKRLHKSLQQKLSSNKCTICSVELSANNSSPHKAVPAIASVTTTSPHTNIIQSLNNTSKSVPAVSHAPESQHIISKGCPVTGSTIPSSLPPSTSTCSTTAAINSSATPTSSNITSQKYPPSTSTASSVSFTKRPYQPVETALRDSERGNTHHPLPSNPPSTTATATASQLPTIEPRRDEWREEPTASCATNADSGDNFTSMLPPPKSASTEAKLSPSCSYRNAVTESANETVTVVGPPILSTAYGDPSSNNHPHPHLPAVASDAAKPVDDFERLWIQSMNEIEQLIQQHQILLENNNTNLDCYTSSG